MTQAEAIRIFQSLMEPIVQRLDRIEADLNSLKEKQNVCNDRTPGSRSDPEAD